ncbi:MAG: hypothetical protein KY476_03655 [Planctomycetes bacterium]|nr:hypothetical protein [Planctomycetota bacterium]
MTRIALDQLTAEMARALSHPVEVCDSRGELLGRFSPAIDPSDYAGLDPEISEEELRRREQSTEWYTTAEVLDHLAKLECSE